MILETFLVILIAYSCFVSYLVFVSLRRINQFENIILKMQNLISYSTEKLKLVDYSGHYESDDETGFFFQQLKELQYILDNLFEEQKGENNAKENKKEK